MHLGYGARQSLASANAELARVRDEAALQATRQRDLETERGYVQESLSILHLSLGISQSCLLLQIGR